MGSRRGFTLLELLIVITLLIILFLALLVGLNPLQQIFRGYDARSKADLHQLQNVFEDYYTDQGHYPPSTVLEHCGGPDLQPYLNAIPCDPSTKLPYKGFFAPKGGTSEAPQSYIVYATVDSTSDDSANEIYKCPQTIAVHSPGVLNADIIQGCNGEIICPTYYGCQSGACVVLATDTPPSCQPNFCDSDCGGANCGQVVNGSYTNECTPF